MRRSFNLIPAICFLVVFIITASGCSSLSERKYDADNTGKQKAHTYTVEIAQMKFSPSELKVKKCDSIIFVNHDLVVHDITEEQTNKWKSAPLANGDSWTMVAQQSSNYYCSIHVVMKGKITVE